MSLTRVRLAPGGLEAGDEVADEVADEVMIWFIDKLTSIHMSSYMHPPT